MLTLLKIGWQLGSPDGGSSLRWDLWLIRGNASVPGTIGYQTAENDKTGPYNSGSGNDYWTLRLSAGGNGHADDTSGSMPGWHVMVRWAEDYGRVSSPSWFLFTTNSAGLSKIKNSRSGPPHR